MRQFIAVVAGALAGVVAVFWLLVAALHPGPEGRIVLATGGASGFYNDLAETWVADLARAGIKLDLRPDLEGANTMKALLAASGTQVDAGIVRGGMASSLQGKLASLEDRKEHDREINSLRSVGRLLYEPIWVFYRGPRQARTLADFKGKRISVGSTASGGRLVATQLLKANGVDASNSTLTYEDLSEDAATIMSDKVDVAFVMSAAEAPRVQKLMRVPNILLMNFDADADAYVNRFPALNKLILRQSSIEFSPEIPSANITLLGTSAVLVARADLHPALTLLLANTVIRRPKSGFDKDGDPVLFYEAGKFPNVQDPEYAVPGDIRTLYQTTEVPLLLRTLAPLAHSMGIKFWVPAFVHLNGSQSLLLLSVLASVILPLTRILPAAYNWSIRRRLLYWYSQLKALEGSIAPEGSDDHLQKKLAELDRIDHSVRRIRVPLAFSDQLYDLRGHIALVGQRLMPRIELRRAAE